MLLLKYHLTLIDTKQKAKTVIFLIIFFNLFNPSKARKSLRRKRLNELEKISERERESNKRERIKETEEDWLQIVLRSQLTGEQ